jgi:tetratricopeptide (TPR) repeat protein/polyferredoxin
MKEGCEDKTGRTRSVELPVLTANAVDSTAIRPSRVSRWRALVLTTLWLLMAAHLVQWWYAGHTVSPIEPSESMYTLQQGAVNAGFIFFSLAILATLIFGRYVCGWGCHIVALQDLCAWFLRKIGLRPRPFRSRLLIYVPLIVAFYMFVWPTLARFFTKPPNEALFPQFTNHLITSDFWATFPPVAVAIPFFLICGFLTVYFLGSKGFCTYGCPYGGVFVLADKVAPGKIRVTDDCNQCGACTTTCMANVQVHAEVAKYGMVVDPGCMKHMDCISVCPNDALYFGFGKPSIAVSTKGSAKSYTLTWPEELLAGVIFFSSFMAVWDVYQLVPMLMALGIAAVTTYLATISLRLFEPVEVPFYRYKLRSKEKIQRAGWLFLAFSAVWIVLNIHSGWIHYNEARGSRAFERVQIPDELALAQPDPAQWLSPADKANIADGKRFLYRAFDGGFVVNPTLLPKLSWLEYLDGNGPQAVNLLALATRHQDGQPKALSLYYRGAMLNRAGRYQDALASLDQALATAPDLILAHEERGEALWLLGRKGEAVQAWNKALEKNPDLPLANYQLSAAAAAAGDSELARNYEQEADEAAPEDPYFHWVIGQRLRNIGMTDLAAKHFKYAATLDPQFSARPPAK